MIGMVVSMWWMSYLFASRAASLSLDSIRRFSNWLPLVVQFSPFIETKI